MERFGGVPDVPSDLTRALEGLPLFPLPNVVLLPGARLPLHVFEPRYRSMVRDALEGHRAIGVVQLAEPEREPGAEAPTLCRVAGLGTILDHAELPGGRFYIVLRGRARVEIEELPFSPPYRRARCTILPSTNEAVSSTATAALISVATGFAELVKQRDPSFDFRMPRLSDAGGIADQCAQHLLIDGRDRQRVLEAADVGERVRIVTETLAMQQLSLSGTNRAVN